MKAQLWQPVQRFRQEEPLRRVAPGGANAGGRLAANGVGLFPVPMTLQVARKHLSLFRLET